MTMPRTLRHPFPLRLLCVMCMVDRTPARPHVCTVQPVMMDRRVKPMDIAMWCERIKPFVNFTNTCVFLFLFSFLFCLFCGGGGGLAVALSFFLAFHPVFLAFHRVVPYAVVLSCCRAVCAYVSFPCATQVMTLISPTHTPFDCEPCNRILCPVLFLFVRANVSQVCNRSHFSLRGFFPALPCLAYCLPTPSLCGKR